MTPLQLLKKIKSEISDENDDYSVGWRDALEHCIAMFEAAAQPPLAGDGAAKADESISADGPAPEA